MRSAISITLLCLALYPAAAQTGKDDMCGRAIAYPPDAITALQTANAIKFEEGSSLYTTYMEANPVVLWTLTKPRHRAHPAILCRAFTQNAEGAWGVSMQVRCYGTKSDCDQLVADFDALNEKMRNYITASKRP